MKLDGPDGFIVADASGRIDDLALKDHVRERLGLPPFQRAPQERLNGVANGHAASENLLSPLSDEELALEFATRHARDLRYCSQWGKWLHFDGQRWDDDKTLLAFDYARAICREASERAAKPHERKDTSSAKKRAAVVSQSA